MSKCLFMAGLLVIASAAPMAFAQTIYEPIRVQWGRENKYYYAGGDPRIHELADALRSPSGLYGRVRGYRFVSDRRVVEFELPRVYSDLHGSEDAYGQGYGASHAYNDAYARQPRYFRKADVLAATPADAGGFRVVPAIPPLRFAPAAPGEIIIRPFRSPLRIGPVFVFPKQMLDRRLDDAKLLRA